MLSITTGRAGSGRHATLVSVAYSILGVLPLFLVSSQAVQLQRELDFGKAGLGLAVSVCFAVSAVAATPLGHIVGRIGAGAGLKLSASFAFAALVWMATVASQWWHVAFALALCGLANAAAQVSTNVVLAGGVPDARQGVAFGAKQAAIPIASLAAGLALPVVAVLAGWRTAFAGAALVGVAALAFRPRLAAGARARARQRAGRPGALLIVTALVGLLAGTMGSAVPAFAVDSAVENGFGESAAGLLLAAGSAAAVLVRVGAGWVADRRGSAGFSELLALTGAGAVAFVALALSGDSHVLHTLATLAVFAAAWGWPGLIYYATVRSHRSAPGAATGFVLSWVYVGNVLGPASVGFIAEHRSYADAWAYGAVVLALATVAALAARRLERVARVAPVEAPA